MYLVLFSVEYAFFVGSCCDGGGEEEGGGNRILVWQLNKLWNFHRHWLVYSAQPCSLFGIVHYAKGCGYAKLPGRWSRS